VKRVSKPNKKITTASQLLPVHGLLSNVFDWQVGDPVYCTAGAEWQGMYSTIPTMFTDIPNSGHDQPEQRYLLLGYVDVVIQFDQMCVVLYKLNILSKFF
jgi:hypothetical protein